MGKGNYNPWPVGSYWWRLTERLNEGWSMYDARRLVKGWSVLGQK